MLSIPGLGVKRKILWREEDQLQHPTADTRASPWYKSGCQQRFDAASRALACSQDWQARGRQGIDPCSVTET